MDEVVRTLDALLRAGRYGELEAASRDLLSQQRFYLFHLYLIVSLLRRGRRAAAGEELDILFAYKFNIADRAWPEFKDAFPEKFSQHYILSTMNPQTGFETGVRVRRHWSVPYPLPDAAAFRAAVEAMLAEPGDGGHRERLQATFGAEFLAQARERLAAAQVIVLTLGVAPSLFHRESGRLAFLEDYRGLLAQGLLYMRTPTVEEVKGVVTDVLRLLRVINNDARVYVTISPVPLMGTAELSNAVLADCVSKSTLRAALHEMLQGTLPLDVHYWSSFEIVRWLGAHSTLPIFGGDDNVSRHVSEWVVKLIVERFSAHLFGEGAAAVEPASASPTVRLPPPPAPGAAKLSRWSER